ncbi:MAG: type II toxin-antitoxin system RelE/ParE family toxin [Nitrosospira sp.]
MIIRYLPDALRDFDEALAYYFERSPDAAQRFAEAVRAEERTIHDFPELAYSPGAGLRTLRLTRFPYSLVYLLGKHEIVIIAVAHQKRRPVYWKKRLRNVK